MRHRGFSLIELMIAMLILVMLATAVTLSLEQLQSHSRDATRKESLQAYQIGFEQFRAASGQYMLYRHISPNTSYPGDSGHGWGLLTRATLSNTHYSSPDSLADVLQAAGYIAKVQVDPRLQPSDITPPHPLTSGVTDQDIRVNGGFTGDYYFVVCDYGNSQIIDTTRQADSKKFTLFATLENTVSRISGSPCIDTSSIATGATSTGFNYAIGE